MEATSNRWIILVALAGILYILGQYVASQPQRIKQEIEAGREITVQGSGKIFATPNVARYTVSVQTGPQATAEAALNQLSQRINAVIASVKAAKVAEKDISTTNLAVNPIYDFTEGRQTLRGFEASQSIEITIRDLDAIGTILAGTVSEGANQAGGLRFEVDDLEKVRLEAQTKAIEDARQKAEQLAKTLGVGLGRVKTFTATGGETQPLLGFARAEALPIDAGGAPDVPIGTQEMSATVSITYELR